MVDKEGRKMKVACEFTIIDKREKEGGGVKRLKNDGRKVKTRETTNWGGRNKLFR